jgi:hypothetical protein
MDYRQAAVIVNRMRRLFGLGLRWGSVMGGCLVAVLGITGCGQQVQRTPARQESDIVRARYLATSVWDGHEFRQEYEVIADRDRRVRISYVRGEWMGRTAGDWTVWDGRSLLDYEQAAEQKYNRYEGGEVEVPPTFVYVEGAQYFNSACPDARHLGTQTVLGRTAVRYACGESAIVGVQDVPGGVHEMSLDQSTRLLLKDAGSAHTVVATEIEPGPSVDADTFSTDLPASPPARVADPARPRSSGTSGGTIEQAWSDVIGGRPAFYLGDKVDGFAVTDVIDADGRILVQYGPCIDPDPNEECVRRPIVTTQPKGLWDQAVDHMRDPASKDETACQRRAPILGVPAALLMGELTVFTGSSMVGLTYYQRAPDGYVPDRAMELRLVGKLRRVGQPAAATLPPPDADVVALLDRECRLG